MSVSQRFGAPGPVPLSDMDPLSRILNPLQTSAALTKVTPLQIVFGVIEMAN